MTLANQIWLPLEAKQMLEAIAIISIFKIQ